MNISSVRDWFENKVVVVVGPANNLVGTHSGEFIDSHDVVCRVNDSFIIDEERRVDYGERCDVLFNSCNVELLCIIARFEKYLKRCSLIVNPGSKVHRQDFELTNRSVEENYRRLNLSIPFYQVEGEFEALMEEQGLNTGMCALAFILSLNVNQLNVQGFSFHGVLDKKYVEGEKVKGYETYLFNYREVYTCKSECPPESVCRLRKDPRALDKKDELWQLEYFREQIAARSEVVLAPTVRELLLKEDWFSRMLRLIGLG